MGCGCFEGVGEYAKETGAEGTEKWICALAGGLETRETIPSPLVEGVKSLGGLGG